jgi:hypothetical protein
VFLQPDPRASELPYWMFNFSVKDSEWDHVPVEVVPPVCLPERLKDSGIAFEISEVVNDPYNLVKAAVKAGVFLKALVLVNPSHRFTI